MPCLYNFQNHTYPLLSRNRFYFNANMFPPVTSLLASLQRCTQQIGQQTTSAPVIPNCVSYNYALQITHKYTDNKLLGVNQHALTHYMYTAIVETTIKCMSTFVLGYLLTIIGRNQQYKFKEMTTFSDTPCSNNNKNNNLSTCIT